MRERPTSTQRAPRPSHGGVVENALDLRARRPRSKKNTSYFQALWPLGLILVGSWLGYYYLINDSIDVARSISQNNAAVKGVLGPDGAARVAEDAASAVVLGLKDAAVAAAAREPVGQGGFRGRNPADIAAANAAAARRAQLEEEGRVMAQERHERDRVEGGRMANEWKTRLDERRAAKSEKRAALPLDDDRVLYKFKRGQARQQEATMAAAAAQKEENERRRVAAEKAQELAVLRARAYEEEQEEMAAATAAAAAAAAT